MTFSDRYTLRVGQQVVELSYHGEAHEPGNIFIRAPAQRVLMVVDVVFPGWMPWHRFALAHGVPGHIAQVEAIRKMDWQRLVGGHVARTGTHADHYLDRVATRCINTLTPKWSTRLAAFDVYVWDQCYAMEESLRIDTLVQYRHRRSGATSRDRVLRCSKPDTTQEVP